MEKLVFVTENRNPDSLNIDRVSTLEAMTLINKEDKSVPLAVEKELGNISKAVELGSQRFLQGGRLITIGAGTSGRLGALDAIELTPTYSVPPERAFGILAGGVEAMFKAIEGAEDSRALGIEDINKNKITAKDIVIGLAASGRTPYTIAALERAKELGALTISVTANPEGELNQVAEISIAPNVGPEVITGSTRMKAGTAQKLVMNMLSTGIMIKSGKVYQNLMVNVQPTNQKLVKRAQSIIQDATGSSATEAATLLEEADKNVAAAIVMKETKVTYKSALATLNKTENNVTQAIEYLRETN